MFHGNGHSCADMCKDLKHEMKNEGDTLSITFTGDKEKIATLEKKLKAMHTLCCDGEGDGCC